MNETAEILARKIANARDGEWVHVTDAEFQLIQEDRYIDVVSFPTMSLWTWILRLVGLA